MNIPSLKTARRRLADALRAIDAWHSDAMRALPGGHFWSDVNELDHERSTQVIAAYAAFETEAAAFAALVAAELADAS